VKLIVLDRDGVINEDSDAYIKNPDEWIPIPGSLESIAKLNRAGYIVVVATNQSGLARGYFDLETLSAMHKKMDDALAQHGGRVDAVFYCPHGPTAKCDCRKPKPGLLWDISDRFEIRMDDVPIVGDSLRDLQAACAVNAKPVLVKTGKGEKTVGFLEEFGLADIPVYENLAAVVDALLKN